MNNQTPLPKTIHPKFIASRVAHYLSVQARHHPQVELRFCPLPLDKLKSSSFPSNHFFKLISALTHALEGSITCGAEGLQLFLSSYGDKAIQLRLECHGTMADPTLKPHSCDRLVQLEDIVYGLGGEVTCLYEHNRLQFEMVVPIKAD